MESYEVLIVDDEKELAETTKDYFNALGIKTEFVTSKTDFLSFFSKNQIKLILLDINLGNDSGYEICRYIRSQSDLPILFISVRTDDHDKVIALGVGGDDFIEKPYSLSVLVAKVKAMLRRCYELQVNDESTIEIDSLSIDLKARIVKVDGMIQDLTVKEYDVLVYLIKNKNKVIKKEQLYDTIWGQDHFGELNTLAVHIRKIREKIEKDPSEPTHLKTVWGIGYIFEV